MLKILLICVLFANTSTVFAEIISSNSPFRYSSNNFQSKLRMNQPKVSIASYTNNNNHRKHYRNRHCHNCHRNNYNHLSNNDLGALEKYALNKVYRRESDLSRLERLENLAFGATQCGDIYSRYQNVENAILSRPKYGTKNSLLNNIASYFSGQATGFTPNLLPYNNFGGYTISPQYIAPNYNNTSFEQYSNGIFGGGWGISGENYGAGSSIKMLD